LLHCLLLAMVLQPWLLLLLLLLQDVVGPRPLSQPLHGQQPGQQQAVRPL
jgi:hypothetical protein